MYKLQRENVNFIEPNTWLPNSQDLNPVDKIAMSISCHIYRRVQKVIETIL